MSVCLFVFLVNYEPTREWDGVQRARQRRLIKKRFCNTDSKQMAKAGNMAGHFAHITRQHDITTTRQHGNTTTRINIKKWSQLLLLSDTQLWPYYPHGNLESSHCCQGSYINDTHTHTQISTLTNTHTLTYLHTNIIFRVCVNWFVFVLSSACDFIVCVPTKIFYALLKS